MKRKYFFLVFTILIIISLGLTACERSASTPPPDDSLGNPPPPAAEGTQTALEVLQAEATEQAQPPEEESVEEPPVEESAAEEGTAEETGAGEPAEETPAEETPAEEAPATEPEQPVTTVGDYPVPEKYVLHAGEFPYCIARRFNINPETLMSANGLSGSNFLPGTELVIPKEAPPYSGQRMLRAHAPYTVQSGDTVYSIACLFGDVDPRAIADANAEVESPDSKLTIGQVLQIP